MADFGIAHFLDQADPLGRFVLAVLLLMSLVSWTLILVKTVQVRQAARGRRASLAAYADLATPAALERWLAETAAADACVRVARAGLEATSRWARRGDRRLLDLPAAGDLIGGSLAMAVAREHDRLENGLATLAAVGSTAPFVGLLGTVWGIYHALVAIGLSGQGSLDQVAGPVGEALVMTAFGLAVAIPAVLAYNAFVRATRRAVGQLEDYAQELLVFLGTGVQATASASPAPVLAPRAAAAGSH